MRRLRAATSTTTVRLADRASRWAFEWARAEVGRRLGAAVEATEGADGRWTVKAPPGFKVEDVVDAIAEEMRAVVAAARAPDALGAPALRPNGGRWGRVGAGVLPQALSTGRVLLGLRSYEVEEPGTWGTWGGAVAGVPSGRALHDPATRRTASRSAIAEGALREFREESGWRGEPVEMVPLLVYREPSFEFHNFLLLVPEEFTPRLNWEHDEAGWFDPDEELPDELHFGLEALLGDPGSALEIGRRRGGQP